MSDTDQTTPRKIPIQQSIATNSNSFYSANEYLGSDSYQSEDLCLFTTPKSFNPDPQSAAFNSPYAGLSALSSLIQRTRTENKTNGLDSDIKNRNQNSTVMDHRNIADKTGSYTCEVNRRLDVYKIKSKSLTDSERVRIVSKNLIQLDEEYVGMSPSPYGRSSYMTASHSLLGGDTTNDIYQWNERRTSIQKRRLSDSDISVVANSQQQDNELRASDLRTPGIRHFVKNHAIKHGKPAPVPITKNFIDFLVLYGTFGGDVYPSDDDDSDAFEELDNSVDDEACGPPLGRSERSPLLSRRSSSVLRTTQGTSPRKVFFMIVKAFVGTGVLFLPKAFSQGGMAFSIILMVIIGYLTLHCMLLLVETSKIVGGSFGEIGEKVYGPNMRTLVLASIASAQMGFSCSYYIFVAQNLKDLIMIISDCQWIPSEWFCIAIQFLFYIPLSWIRKIKHFSITALIADLFILLGLGYILYYDLITLSIDGPANAFVWFNFESFPLFVGTALFAFEGICLILPIADSMQEPEKFGNVLTLCVLCIGALFLVIGATGYLTFGNSVATVVFLNLPKSSPVVTLLQIFYVIAIMLSFPLCVYPAIKITEEVIFGHHKTGKSSLIVKWQKNLYRTILVVFLAAVAFFGSNNLDKFVSLVGCFACIPLSFIYPALFHMKISKSKWVQFKDMLIALFGALAMVYTTYVTVTQWVIGSPDIPLDRCKN